MDIRLNKLTDWVGQIFSNDAVDIKPASADASFRRYFRVSHDDNTFIVMDAPPEKENSEPFVRISAYLKQLELNVSSVLDSLPEQGFYLLNDLGTRPYLDQLSSDNASRLYHDAMQALLVMQHRGAKAEIKLPDYNQELLLFEMSLFPDWYLQHELKVSLSPAQQQVLQSAFELLTDSAMSQPQVFVHRDYHSRNLMYLEDQNPGILDFQDAVWGPVTYDLASLLRDCYIAWPQQRVYAWVNEYFTQLIELGILQNIAAEQFIRWFDLMGVQRHLKASGIFARLKHRDSKPGYINDIPRTLNYVLSVAQRYPELNEFASLLIELKVPVDVAVIGEEPST